jgi:hypothetical protein
MKKIVLAFIFCAVFSNIAALAQEAQQASSTTMPQIEFKGAILGMDLESWKEKPYPYDKDEKIELSSKPVAGAPGVIYRIKIRNRKLNQEIPVTIANQRCLDAQWTFVPCPDGANRLAVIQLAADRVSFALILEALTKKFGTPKTAMRTTTRNCFWDGAAGSRIWLSDNYDSQVCMVKFIYDSLLIKVTSPHANDDL